MTGWKLIQVIPYDYLFSDVEKLKIVFLVFSVFYIVFSIIIALGLSIMLVDPITKLVKKMKEAETGNFDVQIVVNKNDEIGLLGKTFNKMIFEIKYLVQMIKEEEKFKKELELESLHAQINPHFLYNTLNSIKWMAKMQGAKNISSTVTALTKLLRVSISIGNEKITLEEEVEYVKNYILIQKVRFNEQFEVSYSIEENCKKCSIPKLILQPIVENSIIYGINDNERNILKININAYSKENLLIVDVVDNGPGIENNVLKTILNTKKDVNKFSAVGLNNVNERLKLYYGDEYGISIKTEVNEGTNVRITIPYLISEGREINVQSDDS